MSKRKAEDQNDGTKSHRISMEHNASNPPKTDNTSYSSSSSSSSSSTSSTSPPNAILAALTDPNFPGSGTWDDVLELRIEDLEMKFTTELLEIIMTNFNDNDITTAQFLVLRKAWLKQSQQDSNNNAILSNLFFPRFEEQYDCFFSYPPNEPDENYYQNPQCTEGYPDIKDVLADMFANIDVEGFCDLLRFLVASINNARLQDFDLTDELERAEQYLATFSDE